MIKVDGVEYKSFSDVATIEDPALRQEATMEWAKFEHEENKKTDEQKEEEQLAKLRERAKSLGLDENATQEEIEAKDGKDNETDLSERAKAVGLEETSTEEDIIAKEKEIAESNAQGTDTEKSDDDKSKTSTSQETDTGNEEEKEKEREERVKRFAQHHSVPIDSAKKILESAEKIKQKHGGDADEIALAAYSAQQRFNSLQNQLRKQQAMQSNPYDWKEDGVVIRNIDQNGKLKEEKVDKGTVVDNFREKNTSDCEGIDDDAVFRMARRDNENWYRSQIDKIQGRVQEEAQKRSNDFIENIPERDKPFLNDFKEALKSISPEDIADDPNTLLTVLHVVKGVRYDDLQKDVEKKIEAADKRGFERGKKNARILGEETGKPGNKSGGSENNNSPKTGLTDAQKIEAKGRYGSFNISEEHMYANYEEEVNARNKKRS